MKRLLTVASFVAVLAGCGGDTCTSDAAQLASNNASCSLAPGTSAIVRVAVIAKCSDTNPTCQAEFLNNSFEVAPSVQQCQGNVGCTVPGSTISAECAVTIPAGTPAGNYPLTIIGADSSGGQLLVPGTLTVGSGTTCAL